MAINFFKLEKRFLSFLWFWPSPELMTRKELLKIIVNSVLMMTSITGGVFYALAKSKEDLPTSLNALGPVASKFSVLLKVLVLYWNRFHVMDCLGIFKRKMDKGCSTMELLKRSIINFLFSYFQNWLENTRKHL